MFLDTTKPIPTTYRLKRSDDLRESLAEGPGGDTVQVRTFLGLARGNSPAGATRTQNQRWLFRSTLTGRDRAERPSLYLEARVGNAETPSGGVLPDGLLMILRQLAETVKHGRRVTFSVTGADPVTGYLAGIDETHFFVLAPEGELVRYLLVTRDDSPVLEIHPESTYQGESQRFEMDRIIGKFRPAMINRVLGPGDSDARRAG